MKKWTKKQWTLYWIFTLVFAIITFSYLYWFTKKERERIAYISTNGIETVGTIINRARKDNNRSVHYYVHFDFEYEGQRIAQYQQLRNNYKYLYEHAIIGMKYKVKYLPESPERDAVIYIEEPIPSEYVNIEKERERIFSTYKGANKRNARKMEDIQYLIPIEYRN